MLKNTSGENKSKSESKLKVGMLKPSPLNKTAQQPKGVVRKELYRW
jgi:hypothetical protein